MLDVTGNGEFEVIARYVMSAKLSYAGILPRGSTDLANLRKFASDTAPEYMWVHVPTREQNKHSA